VAQFKKKVHKGKKKVERKNIRKWDYGKRKMAELYNDFLD